MNHDMEKEQISGEQMSFLDSENNVIPAKAETSAADRLKEIPEGAEILMPPEKPKPKRSKLENFIQIFLMIVFGSIFAVSAVYLCFNYWNKIQGGQIYGDMANDFNVFVPENENNIELYTALPLSSSDSPMQNLDNRLTSGNTDATDGNTDTADRLNAVRESLKALKDKNPDTYGWIFVEGTDINYPVLRGTDNSYYLTHSHEKKYLAIGSIFADYQLADNIKDNFNTVFYGHNVVTNVPGSSMFHDVEKFLKKDFFDEALIYVYTLDGIFIYKPFSIYPTVSDYQYFKADFETETSFLTYADEYKKNSKVASNIEVGLGDKILTLSTCTNGPQNARYALHAILVDIIE